MLARLRDCRRGATALEFGLVSLPFIMVCVVIIEVAWQYTTASILDAAALRASRFGAVGLNPPPAGNGPANPTCRSGYIPLYLVRSTNGFLETRHLTVQASSTRALSAHLQQPAALQRPAPAPPPLQPQPPQQGQPAPPPPNFGFGGQIVEYDIVYRQAFLTAAGPRWLGLPNEIVHRATIVIKNEPFLNAPC
ncbi:TadE/TadG family type IV pilus assembly protein [Falsiroseomonas oryziterrae]|uniref:TadE/TadG family type IV pilus assembly protein n=1 Tax=Falsiroseomonas oryziterrae TaxID=2911368 RepID=UPI001F1C161C|nr:TadE/TadG family type IV pilus assembly protein [Roseomonas sp. NPKOSM-4]